MMEAAEKRIVTLRAQAVALASDARRLLSALGIWSIAYVAAYVGFPFAIYGLALKSGAMIDAVIGARSIGTLTDDVSTAMFVLGVLGAAALACWFFMRRFEGRAAQIGETLFWISAASVGIVVLIVFGKWITAFFALASIIIALLQPQPKGMVYVAPLLLVLVTWSTMKQSLMFAVSRAGTVGDALGIILLLAVVLCAVLHIVAAFSSSYARYR